MIKLTYEFANRSELMAHLMSTATGGGNVAVTDNDSDAGPTDANAPAVDGSGIPWDSRIHSGNKGMNENGTWRKRKNLPAGLFEQIEAELRANLAPPVVTASSGPAMPPAPPAPPVVADAGPAVPPAPMPGAPDAVAAPPAPPAPPVVTPPASSDFADLMFAISQSMQTPGKMTQAHVKQIEEHWKVATLGALEGQSAKITQIREWLTTNNLLV